ncbi:hypothetical protein HK098_002610 [Nowakowskiella sp. JEL0407]|nr:hypothetical protein HK098_002610 [Nowakowskiella sp. JEL0407]
MHFLISKNFKFQCFKRSFSTSLSSLYKVPVTTVKKGQIIDHKSALWVVMDRYHVTQGRSGAIYKLDLKDIKDGNKFTERFGPSQSVEGVDLESKTFQFLYANNNNLHLLDEETFEEHVFPFRMLDAGDKCVPFLLTNMPIKVLFHESSPILVAVPKQETYEVLESPPPPSSATNDSKGTSFKSVVLENNISIQVPDFVKTGDKIVVDLLDQKYLRKA